MKISAVEAFLVSDQWASSDPDWLDWPYQHSALVRITTDEGVTGVGETLMGMLLPGIVIPIVDHYRPLLIGANPMDTQSIWYTLASSTSWSEAGGARGVRSAIDIALWDIKAKAAGVPLYRLLGGLAHDRMPLYASIGGSISPPTRNVDRFKHYAGMGYTAAKTSVLTNDDWTLTPGGWRIRQPPTPSVGDLEGEKFRILREGMGPEFGIMTQSGEQGNYWTPTPVRDAIRIADAIAPYGLLFYEEPLRLDNIDGYVELRRNTRVAIAAGEEFATTQELHRFLERGAVDIVQPDLTYIGGLTSGIRIAALVEAYGSRLALHVGGSFGPGFAASLHFSLACNEAVILERVPPAAGMQQELCTWPLNIVDGCLLPPPGPGLGVDLTDEFIARHPYMPDGNLPGASSPPDGD